MIARLARRVSAWMRPSASGAGIAPADEWKQALQRFFAERAGEVSTAPTLEDLCYISGRDPRLWAQPRMLDDLAQSIAEQLRLDSRSRVVEVGCASGFIARILAPRVGQYLGVDLAEEALLVAERLGLSNATFRKADGVRLPLESGSVDAALCYDVFTNFPSFADGQEILAEMVRVVRPGGRALIGSIPDEARRAEYEARVGEVSRELERTTGPVLPRPAREGPARNGPAAAIHCYYFNRADFEALGRRLNVATVFHDIHPLNPYFGCRFNVVYEKTAS